MTAIVDSAGGTAATQDVVNGNGAGSEEDQGKRERSRCHRKFEARSIGRSYEPVVQMDFPNGDAQIDTDSESRGTSEESCKDENATDQFREGGDIAQPRRESHTADRVGEWAKIMKNLLISMCCHDCAQCEPHDEKC